MGAFSKHFFIAGRRKMRKGKSLSLQTVELKVRMCCAGCERVVKRAVRKLRGVDSVEVEVEMEKVTVTGYVDRNKVLKEVRRSGKKAEFWPNPDRPLHFTTAEEYFRDEEAFRDSYNYRRHGYNGDRHGRLPAPPLGEERASNFFNDDDVNACNVMYTTRWAPSQGCLHVIDKVCHVRGFYLLINDVIDVEKW